MSPRRESAGQFPGIVYASACPETREGAPPLNQKYIPSQQKSAKIGSKVAKRSIDEMATVLQIAPKRVFE